MLQPPDDAMRRRTPHTSRRLLGFALGAAACTGVAGRAPTRDLDGTTDVASDLPTDEDVAHDADATAPRDADDVPALRSDAARCLGGTKPTVDATDTRVLRAERFTALHAAEPRAGFTDADGRLYVAGYCAECTVPQSSYLGAVWRFDPRTLTLDTTWGARGVAFDGTDSAAAHAWYAGAFDRSGRLLVVGARAVGATTEARVARFDATGRLDATFGANGRVVLTNAQVRAGLVRADARSILVDDDGIFIAGINNDEWNGQPSAAWFARFRENGTLDPTFGTSGVVFEGSINGCFAPQRDGEDYVLACTSADGDLPALLRLDRRGQRAMWPAAPSLSVHPAGRADFVVRALLRDTAGRWIVAGVTSLAFMAGSEAPSAVRFLPDGRPDLTFGRGGVALIPGLRQHVTYSFASVWSLTCEDRLAVGGIVGTDPAIAVLDADGRSVDGDDLWIGRASSGLPYGGMVHALVPLSADRYVVVMQYGAQPNSIGLGTLAL